MNWTIIIIETIIMTIAFTVMILIPLVKNPVWWIHDYPKDIQEEYFKTHERVPSEFFSKTVLVKKGFALVLALLLMLGRLMILPEYQQQGIGKQLFREIQSRLPHNRVWLCTCQQVRSPYEFYLREGFKPYKSERLRVGASAGMEVGLGLTWAYLEK